MKMYSTWDYKNFDPISDNVVDKYPFRIFVSSSIGGTFRIHRFKYIQLLPELYLLAADARFPSDA